jgi:hypothetical protein
VSFHTDSHHHDLHDGDAPLVLEPARLDDAQREKLGAIANLLIPGGEGMPSATEAKVQEKWIDRAFRARPDLGRDLVVILDRIDGSDLQAELARVRSEVPGWFSVITTLIAGSYFMNPRVRKLLGYPSAGPVRRPAYEDESDHYLRDGVLDAVMTRGPLYRPTPDAGSSGGAGA